MIRRWEQAHLILLYQGLIRKCVKILTSPRTRLILFQTQIENTGNTMEACALQRYLQKFGPTAQTQRSALPPGEDLRKWKGRDMQEEKLSPRQESLLLDLSRLQSTQYQLGVKGRGNQ